MQAGTYNVSRKREETFGPWQKSANVGQRELSFVRPVKEWLQTLSDINLKEFSNFVVAYDSFLYLAGTPLKI